jgi:hypothetical protein
MKILKLIFVTFIILFVSCDEQRIEIEYHKIADINDKFPLSTQFEK